MTLKDDMQDDHTLILDDDEFGEAATYKPTGGSPLSITVIVQRNEPELIEDSELLVKSLSVLVANHATRGVTSVNTGLDKINVARRVGGTAEDLVVSEVIEQSDSWWRLRLS